MPFGVDAQTPRIRNILICGRHLDRQHTDAVGIPVQHIDRIRRGSVSIARHQHRTRQFGDAVAVDVVCVNRNRPIGTVAGGILAVQRQITQGTVRIDENIGHQACAAGNLFLCKHGSMAVLHAAGLHPLHSSRCLTGRAFALERHGAFVVLIQTRHALADGIAREEQQILCPVSGQIGQLHGRILGFQDDARCAVPVEIAHGEGAGAVARQTPGEHHAAPPARVDRRKLDRTQRRTAPLDRSGADVAVPLLAVDRYRKFITRCRGGAA